MGGLCDMHGRKMKCGHRKPEDRRLLGRPTFRWKDMKWLLKIYSMEGCAFGSEQGPVARFHDLSNEPLGSINCRDSFN